MARRKLLAWLLSLPSADRLAHLATFNQAQRAEFASHWRLWAREQQLPPEGDAWRIWLILAGRGFGKTRAGAEWVREAAADPMARIALVGASLQEARAVMVEGESGVLAVCPPRRRPKFEPSLRRQTWLNGAQATLCSALEPESLRGPQHSHASRAGPEGSIRQRSARFDRRAAALRDRGDGNHPACLPGGWCGMARACAGGRRLGRAGRKACLPPGRQLAVCCAARWPAVARQVDRTGAALSRFVVVACRTSGTIRRHSG